MCYIFWMYMEDIVNVAAWTTMNNLCYEIAYSFGLGTGWRTESTIYGKRRQKYLSRPLKYCVQNITLWQPFPMCIYLKMPFCHDLLFFSQSTFLTVSFPYFSRGSCKELNFLHPNFQKNKEYLSFPYIAFSFPSKQSLHFKNPGLTESLNTNLLPVHFSYTIFLKPIDKYPIVL